MLQYIKLPSIDQVTALGGPNPGEYWPEGFTADEVDAYVSEDTTIPDHDRQYTTVNAQVLAPNGTLTAAFTIGAAGPNEYLILVPHDKIRAFQIKLAAE